MRNLQYVATPQFKKVFDVIKTHPTALEAYHNRIADGKWLKHLQSDSDFDLKEYATNAVATIKWYSKNPPVQEGAPMNAALNLADLLVASMEADRRMVNLSFIKLLW